MPPLLKFIYSEKSTNFCEIFPLLLTVCTVVKRGRFRKILWPSQNIWILYLNLPQEVRSFGIATITGIFLPYCRLWLNIFQFVAPDLNSTRRFPIDPITPFWSGEVTIATILESVIGREGPLDNNGIYKVVMLRF